MATHWLSRSGHRRLRLLPHVGAWAGPPGGPLSDTEVRLEVLEPLAFELTDPALILDTLARPEVAVEADACDNDPLLVLSCSRCCATTSDRARW